MTDTVLHSFTGGPDGQQPYAGLVQGGDGSLYGTTYLGGSNNAGVVFRVNPNGSGNTPLYSFPGTNGAPFTGVIYPSGLIQGTDGALYGATGLGGASGRGTVFRLNPDGSSYTILHNFDASGGYEPAGGLVQASDGTLFGTTQFGGTAAQGTVFRLGTNGRDFVQLYDFGVLPGDAQGPQAPLLQGADGALYGTSPAGGSSAVGGASGYGTVFKINTDGTGEVVLHSFLPSGSDGQRPLGGLVQGKDGAFYGTTQQGGKLANGGGTGFGTVFKLNPDGNGYAVLHDFEPASGDGQLPDAALVVGNDGELYGTTEQGGANNAGIVFRLAPDGSRYEVLYSFGAGSTDGKNPKAPLLRASGGGLFGTTQFGGTQNSGTVFRLAPAPTLISGIIPLADRGIQVLLSGALGFDYSIQGSTDHVHWVTLTNVYNSSGTMNFTDPQAPKMARRFYRGAWVP